MSTRIEGKLVKVSNTIRACDVCGKEQKYHAELIQLLPDYQTADIKEICRDCETIVNRKNSKLLSWALKLRETWCKRFIAELAAKHGQSSDEPSAALRED